MKKKGLRGKRAGKVLVTLIACMVLCLGMTSNAWAYFNRGTVGISAGQKTVSVTAGSSATVSISLSPASDRQTEGCGMAECPQSCGEKECLDENGQCTCNGKEYKTYTTSVAVSSSNTSVATASYSNGTLSIRGVSEGTAVLTLTASLRQFSSGSTTITVNVSKGTSSDGGSGSGNSGSSGGGNGSSGSGNSGSSSSGSGSSGSSAGGSGSTGSSSGGSNSGGSSSGTGSSGSSQGQTASGGSGVTASNVTGGAVDTQTGEETGEAPNEAASEISVVNSDRGTITFVPISAGEMGADYLTAIQGKEEYVDFQSKDEAGNILYAWEFYGMDVKNAFDMDFGISTRTEPFAGCDLFDGQQAFYIAFSHEGELPGKASVFLQVPAEMENGSQWYLYYYDEETGEAELQADGITVENGFVTLELEHCSDYVLCEKEIAAQQTDTGNLLSSDEEPVSDTAVKSSVNPAAAAVIVIIIAAAAAAAVILAIKKKKRDGDGENPGGGTGNLGGSSDNGAGEP